MGYLGNQPTIGAYHKLDAISTVNGQATYNLLLDSVAFTPQSANHMLVVVNGIVQSPTANYNISGSTIVFTSNLVTGDVINEIRVFGDVLNIGTPSDSTVTNAKTNFVSTSSAAGLSIKGDGTTDGTLQLNCSQNSHGVKIKSPAHSASQSYTLTLPATAPSADKALITDGSGNLSFGSAGGIFESALVHVRDEKSNNTNGGTFSSGAWRTRTLNTVMTNEVTGASLASNQITLPSGTYYIDASAPGYYCQDHKTKLYNITDSSDILIGTSEWSAPSSGNVQSRSFLSGRFTLGAEKVVQFQHRCITSRSTDGFGQATGVGVVEVYADVRMWKVS